MFIENIKESQIFTKLTKQLSITQNHQRKRSSFKKSLKFLFHSRTSRICTSQCCLHRNQQRRLPLQSNCAKISLRAGFQL